MLMSHGRPTTQGASPVAFQPLQVPPAASRNMSGPPTFPISNQWFSSPTGSSPTGNIQRHPASAPVPFPLAPVQPDQAVGTLPRPPTFPRPNQGRPSHYRVPSSCNVPPPLSFPVSLPAPISVSQQALMSNSSEFVKQIVKVTIREYLEIEQTRKGSMGDEIPTCSLSISPNLKEKQWCRWEIGMALVLALVLMMTMCYIAYGWVLELWFGKFHIEFD